MMMAMGDHFVTAVWARDCIVAGDLESSRTAMQDLADYEYPAELTARWGPELSSLKASARTAAQATTLEAGAAGVAEVARLCGDCHAASGGGPATLVARPEHFSKYAEDSFTGRMYRHLWGAEQLWQGLTAPSEAAWEAGATAIRESPAAMERELPAKFGTALEKLRTLSTSAGAPQSAEQRTALYAELLSTCATCHARAEAGALRGR
jgi:mono/diheme cytochrome c family protein